MSTIQYENNYENIVQNQEAPSAPPLKRAKSSVEALKPLDLAKELAEAWKTGAFNGDDADANLNKWLTDDFVHDATSAGHTGGAPFKKYGKEAMKDWFEYAGQHDYKGLEITAVVSPTSPNEVWTRLSSTDAVYKPTGKSNAFVGLFIQTWTDGKLSKMSAIWDNPHRVAAILTSDVDAANDAPIPPAATLPSHEPHPDPKSCWETIFALWAAGDFSKPETKQAALDKYCTTDCVMDTTSTVLPEVLKPYEGHAGVDAWTNDVVGGAWELSNLDVAAVAGLKAGCVMQRLIFDVKHKQTGKEAKGVEVYAEMAYNTDGKFVSCKHFYANPQRLASIYN